MLVRYMHTGTFIVNCIEISNNLLFQIRYLISRREMVHYRQEENPFVKILLTQNEYCLESNILLLRQKINFLC